MLLYLFCLLVLSYALVILICQCRSVHLQCVRLCCPRNTLRDPIRIAAVVVRARDAAASVRSVSQLHHVSLCRTHAASPSDQLSEGSRSCSTRLRLRLRLYLHSS